MHKICKSSRLFISIKKTVANETGKKLFIQGTRTWEGKAVINSDCVNLMQLVIFLFGVCLFEWILNTAYAAWVISRPLLLWQNRMDFRWIILNSNSRTQLKKSSNEVKTNPSLTFWLSLVLLPQVIMHETLLPNESLALRAGWRVWSVSCCKYIVAYNVTLFMRVFVMKEYKIHDGQGLQITYVVSVAIFWGTVKLNESDVYNNEEDILVMCWLLGFI